jgi:F0F1-type ATP synthase membrane subunit a
MRVPRVLHQRHPRIPSAAHGHRADGASRSARDVHAEHQLDDLTMWIVMAVVLVGVILMTRRRDLSPGRAQNAFEFLYEFMSDFG